MVGGDEEKLIVVMENVVDVLEGRISASKLYGQFEWNRAFYTGSSCFVSHLLDDFHH